MRDAYHEELAALTEALVEMTRLVGSAISAPRPRCSTPT
jgi:hypothetical protein